MQYPAAHVLVELRSSKALEPRLRPKEHLECLCALALLLLGFCGGFPATLLAACIQGKKPEDHVFTRNNGGPVKDFRKIWRNVCERAGVTGLFVYDLRRTGARNLRREGVAEGTIMKIGGWKTANIFRRYDIMDEADLEDAAQRLNRKRQKLAQPAVEFGHDFGHDSAETGSQVADTPIARIN